MPDVNDITPKAVGVPPWVLKIAGDMVGVCERADRMGDLTFIWAGKVLIRVERNATKGLVVTFPEAAR